MRIDLHTHSVRSDGTDTPAELIAQASLARLDVVALTDHDNCDGWAEAAAELPAGMTLIGGAEFSTNLHDVHGRSVGVHLLGYLFDPANPAIVAEQQSMVTARANRGGDIVALMAADGLPISIERVREIAGTAPIGRPHIARALLEAGAVATIDDAFQGVLAKSGPYYVHKANTNLFDAVRMIEAAGGVAVLAHPWTRGSDTVLTPTVIRELAAAGLRGIEVDHPDQSPEMRATLGRLCRDLDLIRTGSSDYHGANKTLRIGQERTGEAALDRILELTTGSATIQR